MYLWAFPDLLKLSYMAPYLMERLMRKKGESKLTLNKELYVPSTILTMISNV